MSHGGIVFGLLLRPSVHSHHRVPTYLNAFVQHSNRHCHNSFLNVVTIEMGWQSKSGMHICLYVIKNSFLCRPQWGIFLHSWWGKKPAWKISCFPSCLWVLITVAQHEVQIEWCPELFFSLSSGFIVANLSLLCCWARAQKSTSNFAYILFDARGQLLTCVLWQATLYFEPMVLLPDVHAHRVS